ncbi:MAG: heavy-metal-associated domain-containing protein [Deltaproteobacteria bacterium]|nr:heavy-metal-associated domain-containing protein [Deltaproteobacteria bacterium]
MKAVLDVQGMTCQNCVRHVQKALEKLPGVQTVVVDLASGQATLEGATLPAAPAMTQAVVDAGYQATARP